MNILVISKVDKVGGAAEVAWSLKTGLETCGHNVSMFVCDKTSSDDKVFIIPRPKFLFYLSHLFGTDIDLFQTDYILDTEAFKKADIIHCHNLHGHYFNIKTLLKMSKLKPVIWTLHDMWAVTAYCSHSFGTLDKNGFYDCPKMASKSIFKRFNQFYLRRKKSSVYKRLKINLVTPSKWLEQKVFGSILTDKKLQVIYNGIDLKNRPDVTKQTELRQKLNLPLDKKIVLFVASGGKDNIWKGWKYALKVIESFKDRDDVLFVCIGGKAEQKINNLIFFDYVENKKVLAEYYACANAFMLTSTAESFALVVIEAMFAGLPVVSFEVGVISEVIKHKENGYMAKTANVQDFVIGLNFVLEQDLSANADMLKYNQRLIATEFSVENMTEKYLRLYQQIIKSA